MVRWNFKKQSLEILEAKWRIKLTLSISPYQHPSFLLKHPDWSSTISWMVKEETPSWNWLSWSDLEHKSPSLYQAKNRLANRGHNKPYSCLRSGIALSSSGIVPSKLLLLKSSTSRADNPMNSLGIHPRKLFFGSKLDKISSNQISSCLRTCSK